MGRTIQQGPAPKRADLYNTERECKRGLLVVEATAKGFEKPCIILIDSGRQVIMPDALPWKVVSYMLQRFKRVEVTLSLFAWRQGPMSRYPKSLWT